MILWFSYLVQSGRGSHIIFGSFSDMQLAASTSASLPNRILGVIIITADKAVLIVKHVWPVRNTDDTVPETYRYLVESFASDGGVRAGEWW